MQLHAENTAAAWSSNTTIFENKLWDFLHSFAKFIVFVQRNFYLYANEIYSLDILFVTKMCYVR